MPTENGQNNKMQPDFAKLKPVEEQPNFATLKPVAITPTPENKPALFSDLKTLYGGGEQGIARRLQADIQAGATDIQTGMERGGLAGVPDALKGMIKSGARVAGDIAGTIYAPVATGLNIATGGLLNKFFERTQDIISQDIKDNTRVGVIINKITDNPAVQKFALEHPNAGEDFARALNLLIAKGDRGANIERAITEPQTIVREATNQVYKTVANTPATIRNTIESSFKKTPEEIVNKRVAELNSIDSQYAQMRKASGFSDDGGLASRKRVASTDVLSNAVDDTGTIRTKDVGGAVDQYRELTLNQAEGVVRNNLERLGEKVNLKEVELRLKNQVKTSGLEGADLESALNKIESEISGLKLRADENGNVPLSIIQDAKISTTNNINYFTPPEINTYRKAVAKAYKETIEKNSSLNVAEVNAELGKFLEDIAFLERLDGKKVKGGKLGKYFSQISGNIIGATTGGAVGGPVGSAIGTILGGEAGARIRGSMLKGTLGGEAKLPMSQSPIIKKAIVQGKSPRLALPAPKEGAPRVMVGSGATINLLGKGKTLLGIEEIYSNNLGSRNQQYSPTPTKSSNSISPKSTVESSLLQEARKYKSAEVKLFHGTSKEIIGDIGTKNGLWLAEDSQIAQKYIGEGTKDAKGTIHAFLPKSELKIFDAYEPTFEGKQTQTLQQLRDKYEKLGYDGVRVNDSVRYENQYGNLDKQYHPSIAMFPSGLKKLKAIK